MIKKLLFLLGVSFFFLPSFSHGGNQLYTDINALIKKKGLKATSLGISVFKKLPEKKEKIVYQLNASRLFIPASLTKIATLSALYHYYPSYFKFKTSFLSSATIKNKTQLAGDLFFKAGGDPSFTSESLWNLVNNFTRTGIKEIEGDIVIDSTLYKKSYFLPYTDRSYASPVSAASFNWNSVAVWIRPSKIGSMAQINVDPENTFIKIINKVKTVSKNRNRIYLKRIKHSSKGETFVLEGTIYHKSKEIVKYSNIQSPLFWLGHNIKSFLDQRGIVIKGKIRKGSCSSCKILASFKSKPFSFHTHNMMKYSNNFVTRMLTTHLPVKIGNKKGDLHNGIKFIKKYLNEKIGLKGYKFFEPSGLSRKNRFSAQHFQKILLKDSLQFYHPEMFFSYPIAGGVGTLEERFKKDSSYFSVRAKTGSISGVLGLSGYAITSKNQKIIFTFLYNGSAQKANKARELFDDIVILLLN